MIINYSKNGAAVTEYLKKSLNDAVFVRKYCDKQRTIFSVNPFVFVFDYDRMQNVGFLRPFNAERFTGSKVLYCIFISDNRKEDCANYALNLAQQKELVLFGCECVESRISKGTRLRLDEICGNITNYCPFELKYGVAFPIGD